MTIVFRPVLLQERPWIDGGLTQHPWHRRCAEARTAARALVFIRGIVIGALCSVTRRNLANREKPTWTSSRLLSQNASRVEQEPWTTDNSEFAQEGLAALENSAQSTWCTFTEKSFMLSHALSGFGEHAGAARRRRERRL